MAIVDYSLERFPEELVDHVDLVDGFGELTFGEFDIEAEEQAHRTNLMIAAWIERLATLGGGELPSFLPNHSYVGLCQVEQIGDGKMEKHEVGFFRRRRFPTSWLRPPRPTITLYSWRASQLEFGIIWSSVGFRCEPISDEAEEEIYQRVLAVATS